MQSKDIQAVLEQLVLTVSFLGKETADLVDDYSTRVQQDAIAGVRRKAEKIREASATLRSMLDEAHARTTM